MRVSAITLVALGAIAALLALAVTDEVVPAADPRTAAMRPWLAARAMGVTAYLLLALEVALGLVLSHPRNTAEWRKTKQVFPWHEMVTVFTGPSSRSTSRCWPSIPTPRWAIGALVPGFPEYRPVAIGLGSIALYALVFTALTAKWTRLLPSGWWLRVHRVAAVAFLLTWVHAVLAGTDGGALLPLYIATGVPILAGVGHRWWTARVRPKRAVPGRTAGTDHRPPDRGHRQRGGILMTGEPARRIVRRLAVVALDCRRDRHRRRHCPRGGPVAGGVRAARRRAGEHGRDPCRRRCRVPACGAAGGADQRHRDEAAALRDALPRPASQVGDDADHAAALQARLDKAASRLQKLPGRFKAAQARLAQLNAAAARQAALNAAARSSGGGSRSAGGGGSYDGDHEDEHEDEPDDD
jgi:hypothetical protein